MIHCIPLPNQLLRWSKTGNAVSKLVVGKALTEHSNKEKPCYLLVRKLSSLAFTITFSYPKRFAALVSFREKVQKLALFRIVNLPT